MKKETAQNIVRINEQSYNSIAQEFSYSREYFWPELQHLKSTVKDGAKVLDIGCGNGRLITLFKDKNIEYTGVDSASKLIEIANERHGDEGTFYQADALSLPFPNMAFDNVFSIAVAHHIPSKKFRHRYMSELARVIKPHGTAVITVWNLWQPKFIRKIARYAYESIAGVHDIDPGDIFMTFGQQQTPRYLHAFTKAELRKLIEAHSLRVEWMKVIKRKSGYANIVIVAHKL